MKLGKYLQCLLKDFFVAYGVLMIIVAIFLGIYSTEIIKASLFWQIMLAASAYTFFKFAFVNQYELGKKAAFINCFICSTLADLMVVLWICLFSPNKIVDKNLIIIYIIVGLVIKGLSYAMTYIDGYTQAKQLNEKLSEYKNGGSE
jgi:hypothetical protein